MRCAPRWRDAGVGRGGFQAAFCGTVYGGVAAGHKVLTALGLSGVPIVNVEAGCASGGAALSLGAAPGRVAASTTRCSSSASRRCRAA